MRSYNYVQLLAQSVTLYFANFAVFFENPPIWPKNASKEPNVTGAALLLSHIHIFKTRAVGPHANASFIVAFARQS